MTALRSLEDALPESDIDVRRFRPNLVIDTGGRTGHPELEWAGMRARILKELCGLGPFEPAPAWTGIHAFRRRQA